MMPNINCKDCDGDYMKCPCSPPKIEDAIKFFDGIYKSQKDREDKIEKKYMLLQKKYIALKTKHNKLLEVLIEKTAHETP